MSERLSLDDFLSGPDSEQRILATVQAVAGDESVVEVTRWSESLRRLVGCPQTIPRDNVEAVVPTEHRADGRRIVEILLAEGASVPTLDLLQRANDCGPATRQFAPAFPALGPLDDLRVPYYGNVDPECFRRHQDYCLRTLGVKYAHYCYDRARLACITDPVMAPLPY